MNFFNTNMTKDQSRDTGMAMVLLFLILRVALHRDIFLFFCIALQVVNMTFPRAYRPVAVVWLGLSNLLGSIMSKVLMSVVFFVIVTPIGVLRRLFGQDSLNVHAFKKDDESVMWVRNHKFTANDIERPY
jgi:uncharacterized membrane protein YgdD (TMEM256/DUF423 family)